MDWDIFDVRTCRGCGCTDAEGCWPPCFWVDQAWCSACEYRTGRRLTFIAAMLAFNAAFLAVVAGWLATLSRCQGAVGFGTFSVLSVVVALVLGHVGKRMLEVAS